MADVLQSLLQNRHREAVEVVKADLATDSAFKQTSTGDAPPLLANCSAIWQKTIRVSNKDRIVYVGLPPHFPDEVPKAFVADWKEIHLKNPHVELNGALCTIPDSAAIDSKDPAGLVRYVFNDCEQILKGTGSNDFQNEFSSYWNRCVTNSGQNILIIDSVDQLKNPFSVVFSEKFICAASSTKRLSIWLSHCIGQSTELKDVELGITIHLDAPLLPDKYPNTLDDLISLAESNDSQAADLIKKHVSNDVRKGLALLVQKEGDGAAFAGIVFTGLGLSQLKSPELVQGFRPGKVPADLLRKRAVKLIAQANVTRVAVNRADHGWIHSRGGDGRDLSKKSVLLIGCGSLGGYVAHLLSRAGIGRLTMTDNDHLGWENLGRHILGAFYIGRWKAEAVAEMLTRELPHLEIKGIPKDWRDAFTSDPKFFEGHDLIISTVADWRCERPLNELARKALIPPLFMSWLEPHALAGHCLTILKNGGCFECAANEHGKFNHAVAQFKKPPLSKEPGGCAHYQHYGPTALMPVASMTASVVVESLLNPTQDSFLNTWVSSAEHFKAAEADLAPTWVDEISKSGYLRILRKPWNKSTTCTVCAQTII